MLVPGMYQITHRGERITGRLASQERRLVGYTIQ